MLGFFYGQNENAINGKASFALGSKAKHKTLGRARKPVSQPLKLAELGKTPYVDVYSG